MGEERILKVAICERCEGFVMWSTPEEISEETEKEFAECIADGFKVITEKESEKDKRYVVFLKKCLSGICVKMPMVNILTEATDLYASGKLDKKPKL
jgi:hypothetical protein